MIKERIKKPCDKYGFMGGGKDYGKQVVAYNKQWLDDNKELISHLDELEKLITN